MMPGQADFTLHKAVRDDEVLRRRFDNLARQTFGLSFEPWYQRGYWTQRYIPYALCAGEELVANASVSRMSFAFEGTIKTYIQIGTVMTAPAWRHKGLAAFLMQTILADWRDRCDAVYLYANDGVLSFYPRFGFEKAGETQWRFAVDRRDTPIRKLNMEDAGDLALMRKRYEQGNPYAALSMRDNWGLVMFYCMEPLRDCVYYDEAHQAVIIAGPQGDGMLCYDIYGGEAGSLTEVLGGLVPGGGYPVTLGFMPKDTAGGESFPYREEDTTLFVLKGKENLFARQKVMLPLLSHA